MKSDKRHPGRKSALTPEQKEELSKNYHLEPVKFFAERYGVSHQTIWNAIHEAQKVK